MRTRTLVFTVIVLAAAAGAVYRDQLTPVLHTAVARLTGQAGAPPQTTKATAGDAANGGPRRSNGGGVAVMTASSENVTFPIRRRTIGIVETPASVVVKSRIDSQILEQHVTDGQMVKAGDPLFTLDDKEVKAAIARDEATLARDQALADRARAALARTKELLARNAAAQSALDQAVADAKSADANVAADQATLANDRIRLSYTKIAAPMAGRIGAVRVAPGNLVSATDPNGTGLVTITQVKPIRAAFTLPERELPRVRAAMLRKPPPAVRVLLPGTQTVLATGQIDFLDSSVDTASGTIVAKSNFANEDLRLWPGMYVDVQVDLDMRPDTVTVPSPAVQIGQNGSYVYVVKADKTVEARQVTVLGAEGDRTAIETGLKAGEHVVVEGQLRIGPGSRVTETVRSNAAGSQNEAAVHVDDHS